MGIEPDAKRFMLGYIGANALCVGLASVAGGVSHLVTANLARDYYSVAVGDTILPASPVDSWLWGPILIGMLVSWWFGFIAAPFLFAAMIGGPRRSLVRPLFWFATTALMGWCAATAWNVVYGSYWPKIDIGASALLGLLDRGYLILAFAFAAMALSRWRGKEAPLVEGARNGIYPRPAA